MPPVLSPGERPLRKVRSRERLRPSQTISFAAGAADGAAGGSKEQTSPPWADEVPTAALPLPSSMPSHLALLQHHTLASGELKDMAALAKVHAVIRAAHEQQQQGKRRLPPRQTSFQIDLEKRWKEACAQRRHKSGDDVPSSFARFQVVDTPFAPHLSKHNHLEVLVEEVVPKALNAADEEEAKALCLPGTAGHRTLLWAACWVAFGAAFAKTVVSAVSPSLIADFGMSKQLYGTLSGLPAISSIVVGPMAGALVDKMGADKGCVMFALVVALGSACVSLAMPLQSTALLVASQVVMGVGKGALTTAQKVFLKLACSPSEISFFFALSFSLTHLGTFLAFILSPLVEHASGVGYRASIWTSGAITVACLLCTLPLLGKLKHVEPYLQQPSYTNQSDLSRTASLMMNEEEVSVAGSSDEEEGRASGAVPMAHTVFLDEAELRGATQASAAAGGESKTGDDTAHDDHVEGEEEGGVLFPSTSSFSVSASSTSYLPTLCFQDLCTWPFFFILSTTLCFYAAFLPFETFAVDFLKTNLHFTAARASLGASVIPALSVVLSPPFGALVDKELTPYALLTRRTWARWLWPPGSTQLWSMLLTALGLFVTTLAPNAWVEGFSLVSLGYALSCASLWTVIPHFVPTRSLGLALGVIHAVDDGAILAVQVGIGKLLDLGKTYQTTVLPMLMGFALLAVLCTLPLMRLLHKQLGAPVPALAAAAV